MANKVHDVVIVDGRLLTDVLAEEAITPDYANFKTFVDKASSKKLSAKKSLFWIDSSPKDLKRLVVAGFAVIDCGMSNCGKCSTLSPSSISLDAALIMVEHVVCNPKVVNLIIIGGDESLNSVLQRVVSTKKIQVCIFQFAGKDSWEKFPAGVRNVVLSKGDLEILCVEVCKDRWRCPLGAKCEMRHFNKHKDFFKNFPNAAIRKNCKQTECESKGCSDPTVCLNSHSAMDTFCKSCNRWCDECQCPTTSDHQRGRDVTTSDHQRGRVVMRLKSLPDETFLDVQVGEIVKLFCFDEKFWYGCKISEDYGVLKIPKNFIQIENL